LNNAEKENIGLTKDNDQLKQEIVDLKNQLEKLDSLSKKADQEEQALKNSHTKEVTSKEVEIKSLDMQTHKLQTSLNLSVKSNEKLKEDLKSKETDLSSRIIELEKIGVRYESSIDELKTIKAELKGANKVASDAEKMVAKLEGKLEVYTSMEKQKNDDKNSEE